MSRIQRKEKNERELIVKGAGYPGSNLGRKTEKFVQKFFSFVQILKKRPDKFRQTRAELPINSPTYNTIG